MKIDLKPCPNCGALGWLYPCSECHYDATNGLRQSQREQLYRDHLAGQHTGDTYAAGCPTCESDERFVLTGDDVDDIGAAMARGGLA